MSKNIITIWLDQAVTPDRITYLALCKIDPYLVTFRDSNKCINYITNLHEDENLVVLILTHMEASTCSEVVLQISEELLQVHSVYILYNLFPTNDETSVVLNKLRGVYTELDALCSQLRQLPFISRQRREGFRCTDFIISSLPRSIDATPATITATHSHSSVPDTKSTERQEAEFMYGQLLRDILIDMNPSQAEMVEFCRQKCAGNETDLKVIEEFENYYAACDAILWYTKETFLYRLLNRAMREQDISALYSLRYFIKDLHLQLEQRYNSQQQSTSTQKKNDIAYRGQLMDDEEFDRKIRQNNGGFFSVNGFLSTTRDRSLAAVYAGNKNECDTSKIECVLFEIHIDRSVNKFSYADISDESQFGEGEKEILFTMGAVFRINSEPYDDQNVWIVQLQLTGEEDEELRKLSEVLKKVIKETPKPLVRLLRFIRAIGKYNEVEHLSSLAVQDTSIVSDDNSLADIHNIL